jgi:hypothetical protein
MRGIARGALGTLLLALASLGSAPGAHAEGRERAPKAPSECVRTRTEARYSGYGYDHVVHVTNGCDRKMRCTITTDVNREQATVAIDPGKTESVITQRGSAAREFTAKADCQVTR